MVYLNQCLPSLISQFLSYFKEHLIETPHLVARRMSLDVEASTAIRKRRKRVVVLELARFNRDSNSELALGGKEEVDGCCRNVEILKKKSRKKFHFKLHAFSYFGLTSGCKYLAP
jgi:hypothetical protein